MIRRTAAIFAIVSSYIFVFDVYAMDYKESDIRKSLLSLHRHSQELELRPLHSKQVTSGSFVPGYCAPDVIDSSAYTYSFTSGETTDLKQILELSPNNSVYLQMISCPSLELTCAFESADAEYRVDYHAENFLLLKRFKRIADAGHPLAKERYADLLVARLTAEWEGSTKENENCMRLVWSYDEKHSNHSRRSNTYDFAKHYYAGAIEDYEPSSARLYELKEKMKQLDIRMEDEESRFLSIRKRTFFSAAVIIGGFAAGYCTIYSLYLYFLNKPA